MTSKALSQDQCETLLSIFQVALLQKTYTNGTDSVSFSYCKAGIPKNHTSFRPKQKLPKKRRISKPPPTGDQWRKWSTLSKKDDTALFKLASVLNVEQDDIESVSFMYFTVGIGWHVDEQWVGNSFTGINLSDKSYTLNLKNENGTQFSSVSVEPCSMYTMVGEHRWTWKHKVVLQVIRRLQTNTITRSMKTSAAYLCVLA